MMENQMQMTADDQHRVETFGALEADPNGKKPNEAGAKLDAGKNRLGLVLCGFARALQEVGAVGTYGANKYTDNGWMEVPDGERRYTDAMLRHLMCEAAGEQLDPDTGLHHAAHAAWNALARLDLALRKAPNVEFRPLDAASSRPVAPATPWVDETVAEVLRPNAKVSGA